MAPSRKYDLNQRMYTDGDIYLGDHLTRSWTRDERRVSRQGNSPVVSEPGQQTVSGTNSVYQLKNSHPSISRTRSSLREPRGSRRNWATRSAIQHVSPEEFHEWKQSFDNLLQSPVGSKLFRIFLESEIAEENLLFWEACEELKQLKKEKRIQKLIQNIFDDFISVYSPREINIDYKMREDIVEQLNNSNTPDPNVFKEAQMQIYHLMHRDSYPRFLASAQTVHQLEASRSFQKGSKRQRRESEAKPKANTKSRILCCYGLDHDEPRTHEHFVSMEEHHMVEETPKTPVNGQSIADTPTSKQTESVPKTDEDRSESASPEEISFITPQSGTVTSETQETETRKLSDSPTETSSKRESGIELISCSTHCEDDVINEGSDATKAAENPTKLESTDDILNCPTTHSIEVQKGGSPEATTAATKDNNNVSSSEVKHEIEIPDVKQNDVIETGVINGPKP